MAKKKDKPQVINNIQELNLEIDYDKLADAIVKAQKQSPPTLEMKEKIGFWKGLWLIVRNKEPKSGNVAAFTLAEIMSWIFNFLALAGMAFDIFLVLSMFTTYQWPDSMIMRIFSVVFVVLLCVTTLMISLLCRGIANEIKAEKNREYIITVFSAFVAVVALIVAVIALFKGVG